MGPGQSSHPELSCAPRCRIEISFTPHLTNPWIGPLDRPLGLDRAKRTHRLAWLHVWLWKCGLSASVLRRFETGRWADSVLGLSQGSGPHIPVAGARAGGSGRRFFALRSEAFLRRVDLHY
jgi:hypothetical protein